MEWMLLINNDYFVNRINPNMITESVKSIKIHLNQLHTIIEQLTIENATGPVSNSTQHNGQTPQNRNDN